MILTQYDSTDATDVGQSHQFQVASFLSLASLWLVEGFNYNRKLKILTFVAQIIKRATRTM